MFFGTIADFFRFSMVFLLGSTGEILTEKTGHLNLGTPGIMCVGAAAACWGATIYVNSTPEPVWFLAILVPLIFTLVVTALLGLLYSFLTVSLRANQNVTGLMLTTFGMGLANYIKESLGSAADLAIAKVSVFFRTPLPFFNNVVGFELFGVLVYFAVVIAVIMALMLNRTRTGLHLRAVGENPATADAAGINVTGFRYVGTVVGSAISGLGGLFFILDYMGAWDSGLVATQALGWLAVALVIFAMWKPSFAILGSFVFSALYLMPNYLSTGFEVREIIKMIPYIVTVVVLIVTSILNGKNSQPPASLGLNYFREER